MKKIYCIDFDLFYTILFIGKNYGYFYNVTYRSTVFFLYHLYLSILIILFFNKKLIIEEIKIMESIDNQNHFPLITLLKISKSSGLATFPSLFLSTAEMNWLTYCWVTYLFWPICFKASLINWVISLAYKVPLLSLS